MPDDCPNAENPYHDCNDWCVKHWGLSGLPKKHVPGQQFSTSEIRGKPSSQFPKEFGSSSSSSSSSQKKRQPPAKKGLGAGMGMYGNVQHSYGSSSSSSSSSGGDEGKQTEKREKIMSQAEIEKIEDPRKRKLAELKARMAKARVLNKAEVRAEATGKASNRALSETVKDWDKHEEEEEEEEEDKEGARKRSRSESGEDLLQITAEDAEWQAKKKQKKSKSARILVDYGVEQSARAYGKRLAALDEEGEGESAEYERQKQQTSNFYRSADSLDYGNWETNPEKVDKMANEVKKLVEKRKNYSRRREFFDDADVTYINESNRKLNEKISKYYDEYTTEIRQNLERGTAL